MADEPSLDLLDRALDQTGTLIAAIRPEQATLPTPCSAHTCPACGPSSC